MDSKKNDEIKTDVDIFRDTPLRYMGNFFLFSKKK